MKNLAGNSVSIFLFRFVLQNNAISFVLNEAIAEDLYPETEKEMHPLVHACCETLLRYRTLCSGDTIMDGNILVDGCFEVMLSKGLGKHFKEQEKQNLFNDAHEIAKLLMDVMDRRSKEQKLGNYPGPQPVHGKNGPTEATSKGLEDLGKRKELWEELLFGTPPINPRLKRLSPDQLPDKVMAKRSYDHRGHCISFEHKSMGELGKIILTDIDGKSHLLQAEVAKGELETFEKRQKIFKETVAIIEAGLRGVSEPQNA